MSTRVIEVLVGIFVAAGLGALFTLAMQVSNLSTLNESEGYRVFAYFENIGGLKVRSPVTVSGVRVGRVSDISYDSERYQAKVTLNIDASQGYFPEDTSASIYTSGLLGEQYIALDPGAEEEMLSEGDSLQFTQSAVVLEQLISQVVVNLTSK